MSKIISNEEVVKRILDKLDSLDGKAQRLSDKVDSKIDKIDVRLDSMGVTLVKQEANLAEHMRRTDLLEKAQEELNPLRNIYTVGWGLVKIGAGVGFVASLIATFAKLLALIP